MKTILVYCGRVVEALLWERETAEGKRTSSRYLLLKEIGYLSDTDREKKTGSLTLQRNKERLSSSSLSENGGDRICTTSALSLARIPPIFS